MEENKPLRERLPANVLMKLVVDHTYQDIALEYGSTKQRVYSLYNSYIRTGDIPTDFMRKPIGTLINGDHKIKVYHIDNKDHRILISINGKKPKWVTIYDSERGQHFSWGYKTTEGKVTKVRSYISSIVMEE